MADPQTPPEAPKPVVPEKPAAPEGARADITGQTQAQLDQFATAFYKGLVEKIDLEDKDQSSPPVAELVMAFKNTISSIPHDAPDIQRRLWMDAVKTKLIEIADAKDPGWGKKVDLPRAQAAVAEFKTQPIANFEQWFESANKTGFDEWKAEREQRAAVGKAATTQKQGIEGTLSGLEPNATTLKTKLDGLKSQLDAANGDQTKVDAAQREIDGLKDAIAYVNGINIAKFETDMNANEGGEKAATVDAIAELKKAVGEYDGSEAKKAPVEAAKTKAEEALKELGATQTAEDQAEDAILNEDPSLSGQAESFLKTSFDGKFAAYAPKIVAIMTSIGMALYKIPWIGKSLASFFVSTDMLAKSGVEEAKLMLNVEQRFKDAGIPKKFASNFADKKASDVLALLGKPDELNKIKGFSNVPADRIDKFKTKLSLRMTKVANGKDQTVLALLSPKDIGVDFKYKGTSVITAPPETPETPATPTAPEAPAEDGQKAAK